jgi:hypothetical protein
MLLEDRAGRGEPVVVDAVIGKNVCRIMRCSNSARSSKRPGISKRLSATCFQAPRYSASSTRGLRRRTHHAFVVEHPNHIIESSAVEGLGHMEVATRML